MNETDDKFEHLRASGEWSRFFMFAIDQYAKKVCGGANPLTFSPIDIAASWVWFQQPDRFCRLCQEWETQER